MILSSRPVLAALQNHVTKNNKKLLCYVIQFNMLTVLFCCLKGNDYFPKSVVKNLRFSNISSFNLVILSYNIFINMEYIMQPSDVFHNG